MTHLLKMKTNTLLPTAVLLCALCMLTTACRNEVKTVKSLLEDKVITGNNVVLDSTQNLFIIYPQFTHIDLVCDTMPSIDNKDVIFVCAAAFTGEVNKPFTHMNIAGNHVADGEFHRGYACQKNTGAFFWFNGRWKFLFDSYSETMQKAAQEGGMGFGQMMLFYKGERKEAHMGGRNIFRALCEHKGKLCIAESRRLQDFKFFMNSLEKFGVTNAIYLDMGKGWNHSWYRDNTGAVKVLHPKKHSYCTNWIAFYRD